MANDTLARMFWDRVERSAEAPAQQFKIEGVWKTITWREVGDVVRELALGLIALGRQKGGAVWVLVRIGGGSWAPPFPPPVSRRRPPACESRSASIALCWSSA